MTKYLAIGAAVVILGLVLVAAYLQRDVKRLSAVVAEQAQSLRAAQAQAKVYSIWQKMEGETRAKVAAVLALGDSDVVRGLNELFRPAAGPGAGSGPARGPDPAGPGVDPRP